MLRAAPSQTGAKCHLSGGFDTWPGVKREVGEQSQVHTSMMVGDDPVSTLIHTHTDTHTTILQVTLLLFKKMYPRCKTVLCYSTFRLVFTSASVRASGIEHIPTQHAGRTNRVNTDI